MLTVDPTVFMVGWEYPPHNSGGLGVACEGLTEALALQNTQIYFTLPYQHSQTLGHVKMISCVDDCWQTPTARPPFLAYDSTPVNLPHETPTWDVASLQALPQSELEHRVDEYATVVANQAQTVSFDLVHGHDWMTFPAATQVADESGKPFIAHVHSTEFDRIPSGYGSAFIHQTEYEGLQRADKIIVVSYYTKHILVNRYGVDARKVEVIHNGITPIVPQPLSAQAATFATRRPLVVFMGRLTSQKGPDHFIEVAQEVLKQQPDTLFVIAGQGDLYHQLLLTTAGQQLTASMLFTGFLRGQEREQLLDRADIFVMPSLSEPFGIVALEAAQRHTPVIVSKTAGVSEVMPSALTVDFWDSAKMSSTIVELLQNRQLRQRQTTAQLQELESVTWSKAAIDIKKLYRRVFLG